MNRSVDNRFIGRDARRTDAVEQASGRGVHAASPFDSPGRFNFKRTHHSVRTLKRRERRAPMPFADDPCDWSRCNCIFVRERTNRAFTMVEIAICLAVIGFALVAIIGILPFGMQVQKDNRQQTIINQDARVFLDAIRGGARGFDDLTNYVLAITNYYAIYTSQNPRPVTGTAGYTVNDSFDTLAPGAPKFPIDSGNRIVGLLSLPKYIDRPVNNGVSFRSNHIVAFVRAMSGPASEKFPQTNTAVQDAAFTYRMYVDLVPYCDFNTNWVNYTAYLSNTNGEWQWRSNYWSFARNLQNQLFDLRLTFRWPLNFNGAPGNERQAYRTLVGGMLTVTNDSGNAQNPGNAVENYFLEPRLYATSTNNVLTGKLNQFFPQVP